MIHIWCIHKYTWYIYMIKHYTWLYIHYTWLYTIHVYLFAFRTYLSISLDSSIFIGFLANVLSCYLYERPKIPQLSSKLSSSSAEKPGTWHPNSWDSPFSFTSSPCFQEKNWGEMVNGWNMSTMYHVMKVKISHWNAKSGVASNCSWMEGGTLWIRQIAT